MNPQGSYPFYLVLLGKVCSDASEVCSDFLVSRQGDINRLKFLHVHANIHANTLTFNKKWILVKATVTL